MMRLLLAFVLLCAHGVSQVKTIHVVVALCDNKYQGIVPVPPKIGNGQDPANNLYWGCGYGVKTFFKKQADWKLMKQINAPSDGILERLVFKHKTSNTYLVADAYDGAKIKQSIENCLDYSAGLQKFSIKADSLTLSIGGNSGLICYVGHNGLMDFQVGFPEKQDNQQRDVAIFACASKPFFTEALKKSGANPLMWTTHLMCPEAYTLVALVDGWIKKQTPQVIRENVAQAYNKYHSCGMKGSRNLFVTGW
jgi:hypothetical protein